MNKEIPGILFCPHCGAGRELSGEGWSSVVPLNKHEQENKEGINQWYCVRCGDCGALGPQENSERDAVRGWNRRPFFSELLAESLYKTYFDARQGLDAYGEDLFPWKGLSELDYVEWEAWHQVAEFILGTKWTIRMDEESTDHIESRKIHSTKPESVVYPQKDLKK